MVVTGRFDLLAMRMFLLDDLARSRRSQECVMIRDRSSKPVGKHRPEEKQRKFELLNAALTNTEHKGKGSIDLTSSNQGGEVETGLWESIQGL